MGREPLVGECGVKRRLSIAAIALSGLLLCQSTPPVFAAQPAASEREAHLKSVFTKSADYLGRIKTLCSQPGREKCREITAQAQTHLATGQRNYINGGLTGSDQDEWLNAHAEFYLQLQTELYSIAQKASPEPLSLNLKPSRGACIAMAGWNCDSVMVAATAVCSLYLAVPGMGPALAAACEAAAIYGYIKCNQTVIGGPGDS
jgi:hypothetical protein